MVPLQTIFFTLLLAVALWPIEANAFKRVIQPLNVAIAQADAIVVGRTTRVPERLSADPGQTAEIDISRVLKGELPKGAFTVQLNEFHVRALGALQPGQEYLVFLSAVRGKPRTHEVMLDGTQPFTSQAVEEVASLISLTPAWSEPQEGISTVLVPERYRIKSSEDLNLFVGCRNVSDRTITLLYHDWPLDTHTYWELIVISAAGDKIAAAQHPTLTPESINDYFSTNPRSYGVALEPGQEHFYAIQRVNSAKPGWGHKESLDFKYYPITQTGSYEIAAIAHNLYDGVAMRTGKVAFGWNEVR
jgi:hypothetical protein